MTFSSSRSCIWPCATSDARPRHQLAHVLGRLRRWSPRGCAGRRPGPSRASSFSMAHAHEVVAVLADVGADLVPPARRRLDDRDVADAGERHLQRARDRRRREAQHVDLQLEVAQQLLLAHAEALLLVDDHQAEVLGTHVACRAAGACR